ncbi:breast carcinoma-amplified sequence 4 [Cyrtonyx montezumae]|uniref:breast carcinoma-amplified sequence 4 n=1 Tax=Cyrtonyx montezumae TaxID=9017 RepID=UPI0032DB9B92
MRSGGSAGRSAPQRGVLEIRSDTSEILDESTPLIKGKAMERNCVYAKIDKLEAFIKTVAHHVSFLEEQVLEAGKSHGAFFILFANCFHMHLSHLQKHVLPEWHSLKICWDSTDLKTFSL